MKFGSVGAVIAADSKANAVPLLKVGSIPVVQRIILTLQQAGVFPIVVVTEKEEVEVTHQVAQLGVVFIRNDQPQDRDMFSSVKLGLKFLQGKCNKVVFTPVNAPMFSVYTLQTLLASDEQIVKPTYNGRGGHPIVLKSEVIGQILDYQGSEGLRGALKACKVNTVEVPDSGILMSVHNGKELQEHLKEHNATLLSPTVKLSINKETVFFNSRLKLLLFLIEDLHSARQACFHTGLSYQNAWNMINKLEEETGYTVVTRQRGGKNGGETCLTEKGKQLMHAFQQYEEEVNNFAQQRFNVLFRMGKQAKAVVFDFNGTLFFDYQENKDAWNEVSILYRGRPFEADEYDSMMGLTDPMCVRKMLGDLPSQQLTEVANQKEEIYLRLCKERKLKLEDSAISFIQKLKADNIKVLIASSAPKINMDWYYENLGLKELFERDYIIAGREDLPSKPQPHIFQYALKVAQVAPEEAICFEDAPNGLRAALATPFKKVYGIESPGFDDTLQKTLAPMITWDYALEHYQEIIGL